MTRIVAYMPTYSPTTEAAPLTRSYTRLPQEKIIERIKGVSYINMSKPGMYMDAIDSVLNNPTKVNLIVADGKSTDSIRNGLQEHHKMGAGYSYELKLYPEKMSQWAIFNDIFRENQNADYFVYTCSDIIWTMDVVAEAIKEFEKNPKLQILFPTMTNGDRNCACQIADGVEDKDPHIPPFQDAAKAPVLNAYVMIFRMNFLKTYGGYPDVFRNCYTESFLYYMAQAMGGEMMVLPRANCFHWNEGDKWVGEGGTYNYNAEYEKFEGMMNKLKFAQGMGMLSVDYLREMLIKQEK